MNTPSPNSEHRNAAVGVVTSPGDWLLHTYPREEARRAAVATLERFYDQGFCDERDSLPEAANLPGYLPYLKAFLSQDFSFIAGVKLLQAFDWIYTIGARDCAIQRASESETSDDHARSKQTTG